MTPRGRPSNAGRGSTTARFRRRRRTMFSTSMIASSTTSPSAMMSPAITIVLSVPPIRLSTSAAASRDNGIAVRLMTAVLQSQRNAASTMTTKRQPTSSARLRLASDISMNVAGRKIVESTLTPGSAGCKCGERGLDLSCQLQRVAFGLLLDDEEQAGTAVDDAIADRRRIAFDDVGDIHETADRRSGGGARRLHGRRAHGHQPQIGSRPVRARCA